MASQVPVRSPAVGRRPLTEPTGCGPAPSRRSCMNTHRGPPPDRPHHLAMGSRWRHRRPAVAVSTPESHATHGPECRAVGDHRARWYAERRVAQCNWFCRTASGYANLCASGVSINGLC